MRRLLCLALALLVIAVVAGGALMSIGLIEAVADPVRRETTIDAPQLPAGQPSYRVALLSDIHFGNRGMRRERLDRIVAEVNAAQPDLVVIAGDLVNGRNHRLETDPTDLIAPLSALRARDGVIATPGNHDHWTDLGKVTKALNAAGIVVLANRAVQRGPLLVLGVDDTSSGHADIAATMASARGLTGLPVAVTHSPDIAQRLPASIGTLLAGHTHCGQIIIPRFGSAAQLLRRHVYNPRYQCGVVYDPGRTVVVTGGLGTGSVPFRFGAPPDWWLVTFRGKRMGEWDYSINAPKDRSRRWGPSH